MSKSNKQLEKERVLQKVVTDAVQILLTKGGALSAICRDLGFENLTAKVKDAILSQGIDPQDYYFAHRRFGNWLTLPGAPVGEGLTKEIPARCLQCGDEYLVRYNNLVGGKTTSCKSCSKPTPLPVIVEETGEIFNSLRQAAIELEGLSLYQTLRYHLIHNGVYKLNGKTLKLSKQD